MSDILDRLNEEWLNQSRRSFDTVDGGIAANLLQDAITEIENLRSRRPFYGAECPSYPDCNGGCGLGCTHEIEAARS